MTHKEMAREMREAITSGDRETVNRIRKEFYNSLAAEAKKRNDLLHLNLLAATDECIDAKLNSSAGVLSVLLMFYSFGRENFNFLCSQLHPMLIEMVDIINESNRDNLDIA